MEDVFNNGYGALSQLDNGKSIPRICKLIAEDELPMIMSNDLYLVTIIHLIQRN